MLCEVCGVLSVMCCVLLVVGYACRVLCRVVRLFFLEKIVVVVCRLSSVVG